MSQATSTSTSGNVNFGDPESGKSNWIIAVVIGAVILIGLWIVNRK